MSKPRSIAGFVLIVTAIDFGCAMPETKVTKLGTPRSPRGTSCELTLVSQSDTWPGGKYYAEYEMVGIVEVYVESTNAEPGDPEVKSEVKPRACALGGELLALIASSGLHNRFGKPIPGRTFQFQVLAKKSTAAPQTY
jgi:hypothetical protein